MTVYARPDLTALKAYEVGSAEGFVRLDSNESPFDWPPELKQALCREIEAIEFNRYPTVRRAEVRCLIADMHGVGADQVVMGNGLDEIIFLLMDAFGLGRRVVVQSPSFSEYIAAAMVGGAELVRVPLPGTLQPDVESLVSTAGDDGQCIIMLCNPHSPTGGRVSSDDVARLVEATHGLVVVDEAYIDFCGDSALPLLATPLGNRIVILRTLSKAFGAAGLRLGYSISSPEVAMELEKVRQPFNLDSLSLAAAKTLLSCPDRRDATVAAVVAERARLEQAMATIPGVGWLPSCTNFLLFHVDRWADDAGPVWEGLKRRGVLVRRYANDPVLKGRLRVTVGAPGENDAFTTALREFCEEGR